MYATQCLLPGPWLISRDALTAFDELMDKEAGRLRNIRDRARANAVTQKVNELRSKRSQNSVTPEEQAELVALAEQLLDMGREYLAESRTINIRFKSGRRISVERFEQAFRMPEIADELPSELDADYRCGAVSASINIGSYGVVPAMRIAVSPETDQDSKELYAVLRTWASSTQPTWFQRLWSRATPWQWAGFLWVGLMTLMLITLVAPDRGSFSREQGRAMLEKGLKPGDELKAIEVILAIESRYLPPNRESQFNLMPRWLIAYLFVGIAVCSVLSVAPKFALGVAKGEGRVKFWRYYSNAISVVIPATLLSWFVWPRLVNIVQHWFS
jgi:hypothetical protein